MKLAIGSDHAGLDLKNLLRDELRQQGHEVEDFGTSSADSTDYPDYAKQVGTEVAGGKAELGILVCYSGVGMSISANKIHGVRAALGFLPEEVELTRRHNNANVLALGSHFTTPATARELVKVFLQTQFEGGRHERRVNKIAALELEQGR